MKMIFSYIKKVVCLIMFIALLIGAVIRLNGLWSINVVSGESMDATLKDEQIIISVKPIRINAGDIVIVDNTNNFLKNNGSNAKYIVKRVVGVSGDTVECIDGAIYVNDKAYIEDGSNLKSQYKENYKLTLGKDEYFVIGDNFNNSFDSRLYENKAIPRENIKFKVIIY